MSKRKNERRIETNLASTRLLDRESVVATGLRFAAERMRPDGRRRAIRDLAATARTALDLLAERDEAATETSKHLRTKGEKIAELHVELQRLRDLVGVMETSVARDRDWFAPLATESMRPRSADDPRPLGDEPGLWLGAEPRWIDPGCTEQFAFLPVVPFLATHLAVPPLAAGVVQTMRLTSIHTGLKNHVTQASGGIPAIVYAMRFPADGSKPVDRGGALPEDVSLYPSLPMVVTVRNEGPTRALFECALFGRMIDLDAPIVFPDAVASRKIRGPGAGGRKARSALD